MAGSAAFIFILQIYLAKTISVMFLLLNFPAITGPRSA
jgi:hypothetical protein